MGRGMDKHALGMIEIIGAVDGRKGIAVEDIRAALSAGPLDLVHGERFTGRPVTRIFATASTVVKLRTEVKFSPRDMRRWVDRTLTRERELDAHHPCKTWFLLETDGVLVAGNAAPRLEPLHRALEHLDGQRVIGHLDAVWDLYLRVAERTALRLDEGLSNFGLDGDGRLYYLDDDTYRWDRFISLTQLIGVLFRQYPRLMDPVIDDLGRALAARVMTHFGDEHWLRVIAEEMRGLFFANSAQRRRAEAFVGALDQAYREAAGIGQAHDPGVDRLPPPPADAASLDGDGEPWAVLADVHSNLPALERVLDELKRLGLRRGVVLGDIVGYGPHPEACIEQLAASGFHVVMGNHDHAVASGVTGRGFSANARWAIDWTRRRLPERHRAWLARLPLYLRGDRWLAVHGAPRDKSFFNGYVYRQTYEENLAVLAERQLSACFHGHTHMRGVYYARGNVRGQAEAHKLDLSRYDGVLVCPGSVGQPRSGVPGAEFAVWAPKTRRLELMRLDYDPDPVLRDMEAGGFPGALSERLLRGR